MSEMFKRGKADAQLAFSLEDFRNGESFDRQLQKLLSQFGQLTAAEEQLKRTPDPQEQQLLEQVGRRYTDCLGEMQSADVLEDSDEVYDWDPLQDQLGADFYQELVRQRKIYPRMDQEAAALIAKRERDRADEDELEREIRRQREAQESALRRELAEQAEWSCRQFADELHAAGADQEVLQEMRPVFAGLQKLLQGYRHQGQLAVHAEEAPDEALVSLEFEKARAFIDSQCLPIEEAVRQKQRLREQTEAQNAALAAQAEQNRRNLRQQQENFAALFAKTQETKEALRAAQGLRLENACANFEAWSRVARRAE